MGDFIDSGDADDEQHKNQQQPSERLFFVRLQAGDFWQAFRGRGRLHEFKPKNRQGKQQRTDSNSGRENVEGEVWHEVENRNDARRQEHQHGKDDQKRLAAVNPLSLPSQIDGDGAPHQEQ